MNKEIIINLENCKCVDDIYDMFAKMLKFPEWWGRNWDAFYDCLSDKDFNNLEEGDCIIMINYERTQKDDFNIMTKTFDDLKKFGVNYKLK
jgi:hypothetical protein